MYNLWKISDRFNENKSIVKDYIRTIDSLKGKYHSRISDEELYEKYHDKLPVFFVEDIFKERYVDLEQKIILMENNTYRK